MSDTRNGLSTDDRKSLFLLGLKELGGNISKACEVAGLSSRQTYYNWMNSDEDFANAVKTVQLDVSEALLDEAEEVVKFWLKRLDKDTAKWLLAKLGKSRGYGTKVEVEHTGEAFKNLEYPDEPSLSDWGKAAQPVEKPEAGPADAGNAGTGE